MYQPNPVARKNLNQRPTYVSDIGAKATVFEVHSLICRIGANCSLDFMPLESSFGARDPTKKPLCRLSLLDILVFVDPYDYARVS